MDPLTAALAAAGVAWLSIVVVVHLPRSTMDPRPWRIIGAVAVAMLGLMALGVPLPAWAPLAWMLGGGLVVIARPRGAAAAA